MNFEQHRNHEESPITEIIRSLYNRAGERQQAIDLARRRIDEAENLDEMIPALNNLARMMGVRKEFEEQFPEVFPPDPEDQ